MNRWGFTRDLKVSMSIIDVSSVGRQFQKDGLVHENARYPILRAGQAVRTCCSLMNEVARGWACPLSARECLLCSADCDRRRNCAWSGTSYRSAILKLWVAIQWGVANIRCVGREALQKMQTIDWLFLFSAVPVCGVSLITRNRIIEIDLYSIILYSEI